MDEALKALLDELKQELATLKEANQTIVGRLDAQDTAAASATETMAALQGTVEKLQQDPPTDPPPKSDTPPDMESLQAENAALKTRLDALEAQSTEDRTAREAAQASVAATNLRTALTTAAEAAGMQGTARDSFIEAHIAEFEQVDGGAIQVKGQQSPKDATKPYLVEERIEVLRPTHPHYWPVPKGGDFDNPASDTPAGLQQLEGLEGQDLFNRISQPLATE